MIRGVLGGSFDPVHLGHVAMARKVLAAGLVEVLVVVPAWRSPLKSGVTAGPAHRLAMTRLAFADLPGVVVDDREIARGEVVYTVETLDELHAEHPADDLRLVVGADNLPDFPRWRSPRRILALAEIVVLARRGSDTDLAGLVRLGATAERLHVVADFDVPVSSTDIRAMIGPDSLPEDHLPAAVAGYIRAQRLYGAR